MSSEPSSTSMPVNSWIRPRRRCASGTPRVWMPTSATRSSAGFASTISWAMRLRLLAIACSSRRVLGVVCAGNGNRSPFRPHGTELKDVERAEAYRAGRTASARATGPGVLGVRDELVRLAQRLDRFERVFERRLRNQDLLPRILGLRRMVLDGRLQLRGDARFLEDRFQLFGLGDVAGDGDLNHSSHRIPSSMVAGTASPLSGDGRCLWVAPPLTSSGDPRSGNGTTMISRSRGTTVFGKTACASRSISPPK